MWNDNNIAFTYANFVVKSEENGIKMCLEFSISILDF